MPWNSHSLLTYVRHNLSIEFPHGIGIRRIKFQHRNHLISPCFLSKQYLFIRSFKNYHAGMVNRKSLRVCRKSRKIPSVTPIIPFPNSVYPVFCLVNSGCNHFISRKNLRRKQKKNGKNLVNFGENRQKLSLFREETGKNLVYFGDNGKQPKHISGKDEQREKKDNRR